MIWFLLGSGILAYVAVGLMLGGTALNYIRHLDDFEAAVIVAFWPLALLVGGIMLAARKVSRLLGGSR